MKEAFNIVYTFLNASVWDGYILASPAGLPSVSDFFTMNATDLNAQLEAYIRNQTGTSAHPVGTVAMSAHNATYGVVDPDLRVKGVDGLRVVDASVFVSLGFDWGCGCSNWPCLAAFCYLQSHASSCLCFRRKSGRDDQGFMGIDGMTNNTLTQYFPEGFKAICFLLSPWLQQELIT